MQIDGAKGWKTHWLTQGCLLIIPPYDLGISRKFLSKEFPCDLQNSYRDRNTFSTCRRGKKW